jgi:hypothetical protein
VYVIFYIAYFFILLPCLWSAPHRAKTRARWKTAPPHRVVYEIGGAIMGLIILAALIVMIVAHIG